MIADIFDIQRFSLHDGDGIRTTVFFKGCPLRCKWCHNPESQQKEVQLMFYENKCIGCGKCLEKCPARVLNGKIKTDRSKCALCGNCIAVCPVGANRFAGEKQETDEILKTVLADKMFYGENGGMTVSGGEPSMQSEAVLELIEKAKEKGISTTVETCGFGKREFFEKANALGVTFYFDLKALDKEKHVELCGVNNDLILENLEFLFMKNADIVLRLPLIPGVNDSESDLELLKDFLSSRKGQYRRAEIMKYHNLGMAKANALGKEYEMSKENAADSDASRWLLLLDDKNNNVILSK